MCVAIDDTKPFVACGEASLDDADLCVDTALRVAMETTKKLPKLATMNSRTIRMELVE